MIDPDGIRPNGALLVEASKYRNTSPREKKKKNT
jgi:hypothetical protein